MSPAQVVIPRRLALQLLALAQRRGLQLDAYVLARGRRPTRVTETAEPAAGSRVWARVMDARAARATEPSRGERLRLLTGLDTRGVLQLSAHRWRDGNWQATTLDIVD